MVLGNHPITSWAGGDEREKTQLYSYEPYDTRIPFDSGNTSIFKFGSIHLTKP